MKQHKVFIINTERETSRPPTTAVRKQDYNTIQYNTTSRITPQGVKLEVIIERTRPTQRLGTHSPAVVHRHRLDKIDIDQNSPSV